MPPLTSSDDKTNESAVLSVRDKLEKYNQEKTGSKSERNYDEGKASTSTSSKM